MQGDIYVNKRVFTEVVKASWIKIWLMVLFLLILCMMDVCDGYLQGGISLSTICCKAQFVPAFKEYWNKLNKIIYQRIYNMHNWFSPKLFILFHILFYKNTVGQFLSYDLVCFIIIWPKYFYTNILRYMKIFRYWIFFNFNWMLVY